MSGPTSFYAVYSFKPRFYCHYSYNIIKIDTLIFVHFLEYLLLFLHDNVDEESE